MDFFQAQDFIKQMYPEKEVAFEFDDSCIRVLEIVHTDGKANPICNVEYQQVRALVPGINPIIIPIAPHRVCCTFESAKRHVNGLQVLPTQE